MIRLSVNVNKVATLRNSRGGTVPSVLDAVRDGFAGDLGSSAVLWGTVWAAALAARGTWWGTATFRRENA